MKPLILAFIAAQILSAQSPAFHAPFTKATLTDKPTLYKDDVGYGYEALTDKPPYYFSIQVPEEGNYKVTMTFGDEHAASDTTVKAELRRLMLEQIQTAPGQFVTHTFIVNTRTPGIPTGGDVVREVKLKDREKTTEAIAWDNKITLEFTGPHPAVRTIEVEKADPKLPTLYIAGDSTSTDQPLETFNSWGQMITRFYSSDIAVANHGESGESLRSFIGEQRFAKVMSLIKPGDFLFIQMGHNDQKEKGEGVGAFTTYAAALKIFINSARHLGATPVLITPVSRLSFDPAHPDKILNSLGDYPKAVRKVGKEENVPVIDLNAMSQCFYEALGPETSHLAFAGSDTTHHDNYGSYELAKAIVTAIKQQNLPTAKYLLDVPPFDPSRPDPVATFDIPAEPRAPTSPDRPYGQ